MKNQIYMHMVILYTYKNQVKEFNSYIFIKITELFCFISTKNLIIEIILL